MWRRYVAIGDSTTEGIDDPDGRGGYRGWADRFALTVARAQGSLEYANLAISGKLTREIRREQLDAALALEPDLTTVVAGMNDLIRPSFDARAVAADIEAMWRALRDAGATVVSFTLPSPGPGMPVARLVRPRVARFNRALRESAGRTGVLLLDLEANPVASDPRLWSDDKLHANSEGHARIAAGLAATVGIAADGAWAEPLPPMIAQPLRKAVLSDLVWIRRYAAPWVIRHLRGQSSGDGRTAKRPIPQQVILDA